MTSVEYEVFRFVTIDMHENEPVMQEQRQEQDNAVCPTHLSLIELLRPNPSQREVKSRMRVCAVLWLDATPSAIIVPMSIGATVESLAKVIAEDDDVEKGASAWKLNDKESQTQKSLEKMGNERLPEKYKIPLVELAVAIKEGNESVWHLYVVRVPERDRVVAELNAAGIGAGIHYPTPCHKQGAYASLGYREGAFPVAEKAASEILSLPIFPGITAAQQEHVAELLLRLV